MAGLGMCFSTWVRLVSTISRDMPMPTRFPSKLHSREERLFVDPGTYCYDDSNERRYDRASSSHNTVSIDEVDSSEVWDIFRVGRRARPRNVSCNAAGGNLSRRGIARRLYAPCGTAVSYSQRGNIGTRMPYDCRRNYRPAAGIRSVGGLLLAPGWTATQSRGRLGNQQAQ